MGSSFISGRERGTGKSFKVSAGDRKILVLAGVAISCLWGLDVFTTLLAIQHGAWELNAIPSLLLTVGPIGFILVKALGVALVVSVAWRLVAQGSRKPALRALGIVVALSAGIVAWNTIMIFAMSGILPL